VGIVHTMSTRVAGTAELQTPPRGPRGVLPAALALVLFALLTTLVASRSGPSLPSVQATPLSVHELAFRDRADGAVIVTFPGALPARSVVLAPGTHNFIRGVMRGLARDRKARGVGSSEVFRLIQRNDGRLELEDPATGRLISLESFGPTNRAEFHALINPAPGT